MKSSWVPNTILLNQTPGYYLFHRQSLYSRVAFINTSSCQRGNLWRNGLLTPTQCIMHSGHVLAHVHNYRVSAKNELVKIIEMF